METKQTNQEQVVNSDEIIKAVKQSIESTMSGFGGLSGIDESKLSQLMLSAIEQSKITNKQEEETEEVSDMILETGWYDEKSGKLDPTKIKNPEVLAALQMLESRYNTEREDRIISDAITAELKNYPLNISTDMLRKVLDTSTVKIKDGQVTGVKEAFDALKQAEPGFFKASREKSSPLSESFNPVDRSNSVEAGSFAQAFSMMEENN